MEWPNPFQDRRRQKRFQIVGQVQAYLEGQGTPVVVRDIGLGGFSIETPVSFDPGAVHAFAFTVTPGWSAVLRARVVHCRPEVTGTPPVYLTGFEFVTTPASELVLVELIERIGSRVTGQKC